MHMNAQLLASNVGFSYGPRQILRDISLTLGPGDRIGVVGPNGTGKSTLLRLLCGELSGETGTVSTNPPTATVGLMHQQLADMAGETVGEYLTRSTGVGAVLAEFEGSLAAVAEGHAGADDRYDSALSQYLAVDAATIEMRTDQVLAQVGLGDLDAAHRTAELSGGQRTKVNLAAMLLASFDMLLLDEPTNDLDHGGLELLEQVLLTQQRPVAVVSHDRAFLERVVTAVFELDDHTHTGNRFNGGFGAWLHARDIARQHQYDAYHEFNAKRSQLQERAKTQQSWSAAGVRKAKGDKSEGDKFIRAQRMATSEKVAGKAKQTERALERLERNERVDAPWEPWELQLDFAEADRSGTDVAVLQAATVHQGDFVLGPVDVAVTAGDRIMITGANGSGKTTLLRALFGEIDLASGLQQVGRSVRVSTLRQQRDLFADAPSLLRGFIDAVGCDDHEARSQLAKLGLDTQRIDRTVADLSPGEQTRAALGLFAARGANVLVLDEPTNHLDLPAIEQLEAALAAFPHTVLLVTHDRRLIENVSTNRHWHMDAGSLTER
ncbi:MAG: ABC-F family ATP-binding cassette domain-containing protein [Acidimicrobiales bacterium]|jgi:ATPase subunit of ABC transporter with duplicated ATPase domains